MKTSLRIVLFTAHLLLFTFFSNRSYSQTDQIVFDYDVSSCTACGDSMIYTSDQRDSFSDATALAKYVKSIKVKLYLFTCYNGTIDLLLNNKHVGTFNVTSNCTCGGCDSVNVTLDEKAINATYNYGAKNRWQLLPSGGNEIYLDRVIFERTFGDRADRDAGVIGLNSPALRACSGTASISVQVANLGKKAFTGVDVAWDWKGVGQTTATYSGTIDTIGSSSGNSVSVTLGTQSISKGTKYALRTWTKNPGGSADTTNFNDTLTTNIYGSYADTITVGGSSPNFSTIQGSINALMEYGICGPVVVMIRPGSYFEQLTMGPVPGADSTNTITFTSSTGDSTDVVISNGGSSSANYTWKFISTGYITIKNLTIEATSTSYSRVIHLNADIFNIRFQNCELTSPSTTSTSTIRAIIYRDIATSSDVTESFALVQCLLRGGSTGLYMSNGYSMYANGTRLVNNHFTGQYYIGIYINNHSNTDISGNLIDRPSGLYYYGYGLYLSSSQGELNVIGNRIYCGTSSYGLYVSSHNGSSVNRGLIANNFISVKSTLTYGNEYTVYLAYSSYLDFYFNNLYREQSFAGSALKVEEGSDVRIKNNILGNYSTGTLFDYTKSGGSNISSSDFNNYFNKGSNLGSFLGASINSLSDFNSKSKTDSFSKISNPGFVSYMDLHSYGVDLDGNAQADSRITTDIDGNIRTSAPDIGASEFDLLAADAGILEIEKFTEGHGCFEVVIKNYGKDTITSVDVDWKLNGTAKTGVSWTGSLPSGDTAHICLDTTTFLRTAVYNLKVWTSDPNSVLDSFNSNDTIENTLYIALSGDYTLGGTSPDFVSFDSAVKALERGGVIDSARFLVRDGIYTEQIIIGEIPCASKKGSVIFQSQSADSSKVILQNGSTSYSTNYVVSLFETYGITFRHMTLRNTSTSSYRGVVRLEGVCQNILFDHCYFRNLDSSNTNYYGNLVDGYLQGATNICFTNNYFKYGNYGLYLYGSYSSRLNGLIVENNRFENQTNTANYFYDLDNLTFINNDISCSNTTTNYGVYIYDLSGMGRIERNSINIKSSVSEVSLYVGYYHSNSDTLKVLNNMILSESGDVNYALSLEDCEPILFAYNSVLNRSTDSSSKYSAALYLSGCDIQMYNNIISHTEHGKVIYQDYDNGTVSDHNCFYSNGSTFIDWEGSTYNGLSSFISGEQLDSNSLQHKPIFQSKNDLHIGDIALDGMAKPLVGVNKDFDGETRNSVNPDIGADEFTPPPVDAGVISFVSPGAVFKADTVDIIVAVYNFGTDTLNEVSTNGKVNSTLLTSVKSVRKIAPGDSIHVRLGNHIFSVDSAYSFTAWTFNPNASTDGNSANDTLVESSRYAALEGVYTIGGSSPDFLNFTQAVKALKRGGIIDSVRFRVRTGTYSEQLSFGNISGVFGKNSIIFESESKDSSSVVLEYSASAYDTNYTVLFDGASDITFRYLTIKAKGSSYATVFQFEGITNNLCITNCEIVGIQTTSTTYYRSLMYSPSDENNSLHITNNRFLEGSSAIILYEYSNSSPYIGSRDLLIQGNTFRGQYGDYGIYIYEADSVTISDNDLEMNEYNYGYGIYLDYITSQCRVERNKISMIKGERGIVVYSCGSSSNNSLIANNFVAMSDLTNGNKYGISSQYSDSVSILYNSVNVLGNSSNDNGLYIYYGSNVIQNNNINLGKGLCLSGYYGVSAMDYNNLRSGGARIANYLGVDYSTLSDWRLGSGFDTNSVSIDPSFTSSTDLHTKNLSLNGVGKPHHLVDIDIDLESRDSLNPDIGADEFVPPPLDAGISDVIVPKMPFPSDTQEVVVVVRNFGLDSITSVKVNWAMNGVTQTAITVSDTLYSDDTVRVNLGKWFFELDSSYDFKAWTSLPNNSADPIADNDTFTLLDQSPGLSGIYIIGGLNPDFDSISNAISALKKYGIYDSVRFDIRSGTYSVQMELGNIMGVSGKNSIIFQSETQDSADVYIAANTAYGMNYTILLDSANGFTFRDLTITTASSSYNTAVYITGGSKNINFERCRFIGSTANTTSVNQYLVYAYAYDNQTVMNDLCWDKCDFDNGSMGLYVYGYYGFSPNSSGLRITNCNFKNQYYASLYVSNYDDIFLFGNKLNLKTSSYSYGYALYVQGVNRFKILSNFTKSNYYMSMYLSSCNGSSSDTGVVANNMIVGGSSCTYPLYMVGCSNFYFAHNNLLQTNSSSSVYGAYISSSTNTRILNNNFINSGNGNAMYLTSYPTQCNYNNFWTKGSTLIYHAGSSYTSLAAYKSGSGFGSNSLNVDPQYYSSTDLHVKTSDLDKAGYSLFHIIPTDYDDEARDSMTPDIGADEFEIPAEDDAGISAMFGPVAPVSTGTNQIVATIKNFGSDTLKSATINYSINGGTTSTFSWTGSLTTSQTNNANIGSFSVSAGTKYVIKIWTSNPNGVSDTINVNDTFTSPAMYAGLLGTYTVGGSTPDFTTIGDAAARLQTAGILGNVYFAIRSGTYAESITLKDYPGAQSARIVCFQSQSGSSSSVTWKPASSSEQRIIYLNGADQICIRNVTFESSFSGTIRMIELDNGSNNCEIRQNNFKMNSTSYGYPYQYGIWSDKDRDDSLKIVGNSFNNGYIALYLYGVSANPEVGAIIDSNSFTGQKTNSTYLRYVESSKIRHNNWSTSTNSGNSTLLYILDSKGEMQISHNKFLQSTNAYAMYWYRHIGNSASKAHLFNNFVSSNANTSSNTGLYLRSSSYINLYNNSFHMYNGNSSARTINIDYCTDLQLLNNIFSNGGTGYAFFSYNSTFNSIDYNDYYSGGSNLANYNSSDYSSFSAFKSAIGSNGHSINVNPFFNSDTDLHTGMVNLDSAAIPLSIVVDDIDGQSRDATKPDIGADEFNSLPKNLGILSIITPTNDCDLDTVKVKVVVYNFGSQQQMSFPIRYQLDNGPIDSVWVSDSILPGQSLVVEFDSIEVLQLNTAYNIAIWTDLPTEQFRTNDTLKVLFTNYQRPDSVLSMVPADSAKDINYPISLSWLPTSGSTLYDLYLWDTSASKPTTPFAEGISQISYQISNGLTYGTSYYWEVVAKNPQCNTPGKRQVFTLKHLPDLIVKSVTIPSSAFSSTNISVSWSVKNQGQGNSSGTWYDRVYLSDDALLGGDTYLGEFSNPSAPSAGGTYSKTVSVKLPDGVTGTHHIFVTTNYRNNPAETNFSNNTARDSGSGMNISLTPPPDLIVTSVIAPTNGFSGSKANITYSVKNDGTGATRSGQWYDYIYISVDSNINNGYTYLKTVQRNGNLDVDSSYTAFAEINIPNNISGKRFIVVKTDATLREYEHAAESNNQGMDSMNIILTPPPDLVVKDVVFSDSVSNKQYVNVSYNTINEGGTSTGRSFYDGVYLSSNPVLNVSNAHFLGSVFQYTLASGDTSKVSRGFQIPTNINGKYYLFVVADYTDYVEELTKDNNNASNAYTTRVLSPDLVPRHVLVDAVDTTGHMTTITYYVKNIGVGGDYGGTRTDSIFMHSSATWSTSALKVGTKLYTPVILAGDSLFVTASVKIPDGKDGDRYFFVHTDARTQVFENGSDANNRDVSNKMQVVLAPYPDLIPRLDAYPDTSSAGDLVKFEFNVRNDGDTTAKRSWIDRVYLSSDSMFSPSTDTRLASITRSTDLLKNASYDVTNYAALPSNLVAGNYYFILITDENNTVYEHFGDTANVVISPRVYIKGYPPIDLFLECPDITDTMESGNSYALTYTVKNNGDAKTASGYWTDVVYLSSDASYSSNDQLIGSISRTGDLAKGASYTVNRMIAIPNGLSGNYYVLIRIDTADRNVDVNLSNNVRAACDGSLNAELKRINLTIPPDLTINSWSIPSTGTSGQEINIQWTVKNVGSGTTKSGAWVDKVYLSTDYVIDNSDYVLGTSTRSGDLSPGSSYSVNKNFTIPISKSGNFIVIIKTDVTNAVYEHNKETNNTASSISTFSLAPPSDLIVSQIISPDSVKSGGNILVTWKLKNQGSNPAQGYCVDNVYLSVDKNVDAGDLLLGSDNAYLSLGQGSELTKNRTYNVSGVPLGNYYVLVQTDVLNGINESIDTNNTLNSFNQLNVDVPLITIGTIYNDTLPNNNSQYYRFVVPDSLKGESFLVTLRADSAKGNNEMYVRYVSLVTAADFDYKHGQPFQGNQEIIIPEVDSGTYYLLVTGNTSGGSVQNLEILIRVLPFEIRRVSPVSGGREGDVTLKIEGSKFTEGTEFYLGDLPGLPNSATYGEFDNYVGSGAQAVIEFQDPTIAYASFNLRPLEFGDQDVVAIRPADEKGGLSATLEDGFEVVASGQEDVQVEVLYPSSTRANAIITMKVIFTNKGNNDVIGKKLVVSSTAGAPIAFSEADLSKGETTIEFIMEETGGPPGRLRPDGNGSVVIYTKTSSALGIIVQQQ